MKSIKQRKQRQLEAQISIIMIINNGSVMWRSGVMALMA
jgi:hypothetical protein